VALAVDATALLTENVAFEPETTFWLIGPEILKVTAGAIVIESGAAVLFPALFLAIKLSKKLPEAVGVPEMRPDVVLSASPVGRVPITAYPVNGALVAVIW
jgi:hypothetical protein